MNVLKIGPNRLVQLIKTRIGLITGPDILETYDILEMVGTGKESLKTGLLNFYFIF